MKFKNYKLLSIMLTASFLLMYTVMFLNVAQTGHIYLNINRLYMAFLMVSPMALLMILLMGPMYTNKKLNIFIGLAGVFIFLLSFTFLRNQTLIGDQQYMKAMIPHHSSAILTSRNATITDPEVRELADQIIQTQEEEIAQMKKILDRMQKNEHHNK